MLDLGPPFGWDEEFYNDKTKLEDFMRNMEALEENEEKYKFNDILENLVVLAIINKEIIEYINEKKEEGAYGRK